VLSDIAEFERDPILQRTSEAAPAPWPKAKGSARSAKLTKHQAREALKRVAAGEPLREIALSYRSVGRGGPNLGRGKGAGSDGATTCMPRWTGIRLSWTGMRI
jgi:hypothetical protein